MEPATVPFSGSTEPIPGRCGRLLRKWKAKWGHKRYCKNYPMKYRDCCKFCGGKAPRGIAAPNFKNGDFSRYLFKDKDILARYLAAQRDPELLSHVEDIAALEAVKMHHAKRGDWEKFEKTIERILKHRVAEDRRRRALGDDELTARAFLIVRRALDGIAAAVNLKVLDVALKRALLEDMQESVTKVIGVGKTAAAEKKKAS